MNHRPVCVKCQREMIPAKNGIGVLDMTDFGPYKVWDADLWRCPDCGHEIITGFGCNAIAYIGDENFDIALDAYRRGSGLVESRV